MNISEIVIERFFRGTCSEEEKAAVMAYFKDHPDSWAQYVTPESWQHFQPSEALPSAVSDKMRNVIEASVAQKARLRTMVRKGLVAAAVLLPLIIAALLVTRDKRPAQDKLAMASGAADSLWVQLQNTTNKSKVLTLTDGSKVTLEPESAIKYRKDFSKKDRVVYLTGQALFSVTGNRKQPFMVHAGGLTTTVLGTVFKITAWNNRAKNIRVQLLSGKVMVTPDSLLPDESMRTTYLQPGQELQYNALRKLITVNSINEQQGKVPAIATTVVPARKILDALTFNDEPLMNVFSDIEAKCGVRFVYNKSILTDRNFTGSFTVGKDSLSIFLSDIAALNNLTINTKENVVYITP
ncbi:FecR family protein [Filimonas lacunae]|uniref:FecR family protein n=1 Tax=Filimonas lacunae TaxID=477680 RepID=A0A173MH73_9BACT|nr:FecR family protein [Filimonas lacunae]BAV06846.1 anti-sigma factor [Filimonas lacunae]SIS98925.1 FecR family protein [Filimonas lacunae]